MNPSPSEYNKSNHIPYINDAVKNITIVTGASKGIGKAIAIEIANSETLMVCIARSDQKGLLDTVDTIRKEGYEAYPILCDVSNYSSVSEAFDEISMLKLPVQTLINNAGISMQKLFTDTSPEDWHHVINTNLGSMYNLCHHAVKDMIREQNGRIVNISSIWGNDGASMEVAYSTSKGGVNSFTKALAKELGPSNITVNAIACGVIDTSMNSFLSEEDAQDLKDSISLGRYGQPREVASFVRSILETGTYLNGQVITLDGGMY